MKNTHVTYGLIMGIATALVSLGLYLMGVAFKDGVKYVTMLPMLVGTILNAFAFSKANDGYVTFKNIFGSGYKANLISGVIGLAYVFVCIFVFPEMKDKALELAREQMAKDPKVTDEIMDTALDVTRKFYNPILIFGSIIGTLIGGAIFSLIGAAIPPKKGERPLSSDIF